MGTLPEIVSLTAGALHQLTHLTPQPELDLERMRQNLDATQGLIFAEAVTAALGGKIPLTQARQLVDAAVHRATKEKRHLREVLAQEKTVTQHLPPADLENFFDPRNYFGSGKPQR